MNAIAEHRRVPVKLIEPHRCSDFDMDCSHVIDHDACHRGGTFRMRCSGELVEVEPADGYCPYLSAHLRAQEGRGE